MGGYSQGPLTQAGLSQPGGMSQPGLSQPDLSQVQYLSAFQNYKKCVSVSSLGSRYLLDRYISSSLL